MIHYLGFTLFSCFEIHPFTDLILFFGIALVSPLPLIISFSLSIFLSLSLYLSLSLSHCLCIYSILYILFGFISPATKICLAYQPEHSTHFDRPTNRPNQNRSQPDCYTPTRIYPFRNDICPTQPDPTSYGNYSGKAGVNQVNPTIQESDQKAIGDANDANNGQLKARHVSFSNPEASQSPDQTENDKDPKLVEEIAMHKLD